VFDAFGDFILFVVTIFFVRILFVSNFYSTEVVKEQMEAARKKTKKVNEEDFFVVQKK